MKILWMKVDFPTDPENAQEYVKNQFIENKAKLETWISQNNINLTIVNENLSLFNILVIECDDEVTKLVEIAFPDWKITENQTLRRIDFNEQTAKTVSGPVF